MSLVLNIFFGQFLSILIAVSAIVNEVLFKVHKVSLQSFQTLGTYLLLACIFVPQSIVAKRVYSFRAVLQKNGWLFMLGAIADCMGNIFCIRTYEYLPLPQAAILLSLSTPAVFLLSHLFLGYKFRWNHYLGACLCLAALCVLYADGIWDFSQNLSNLLPGYCFGSVGSILYGISNVVAEYLSKDLQHSCDYMTFLSTGGIFWCIVYLSIFGLEEVSVFFTPHPYQIYALIAIYCIAICIFYAGTPWFLKRASATLFNVSLLTVNLYSMAAGIVLFNQQISLNLLASAILVSIGIILFTIEFGTKPHKHIDVA